MRLVDDWTTRPDQRPTIDAQIIELAREIAGSPHPVPLEARSV